MAASPDLHELIARRFPRALRTDQPRRELLSSGWPYLDQSLEGGLARGELLWVHARPGGGGLSLASTWARRVAATGGCVLVVDARDTTLPHAWVPSSTHGAIWVVRPQREQAWFALDLALRAGGFELVVALDAPHARDAARVRQLVRERETRLVLVGDVAPLTTSLTAGISVEGIEWIGAPHGDAPQSRTLRVSAESQPEGVTVVEVGIIVVDVHTDRLRSRPRAPDRSTSRHTKPR